MGGTYVVHIQLSVALFTTVHALASIEFVVGYLIPERLRSGRKVPQYEYLYCLAE